MKNLVFLILLSMSQIGFSQRDFAEIKGKVFSISEYSHDTLLIRDALVKVKINDSVQIKILTREDGKYDLKLKKFSGSIIISVETGHQTTSSSKKDCGYMAPRESRFIDDLSKSDLYITDFAAIPMICCPSAPTLNFKFNSVEFYYDKSNSRNIEHPDSTLSRLLTILKENPGITLEICGHEDSQENKAESLSTKRSQLVYDFLISEGINKKRLFIKPFGSKQMLMSNDIIKKAKTKSEQQALRQMNCRVAFRILNYDFNEHTDKN